MHATANPGSWEEPACEAEPLSEATRTSNLAALYEEYFSFVWRSVRRLGVEEPSAEDAVQEVFIVVHRRMQSYDPRASLRAWLFGIVLGVVRNHRRAARRKGKVLEPMEDGDADAATRPSQPGPYECAEKADGARVLYELLDELDDERREVFVLAELEQLTAVEIADALAINPNTIYSRLRAARRDFEQAVARHKARDTWRLR